MINNSLPRKSIQMCFNCSQTKKLRTFEMGRQNQQCSTKTITTSCQEHVQTSKDRQENAMKERTQFFSSTRHHVSCKGLWASLQAVGPLISPSFISRVCKEYNYLKDFFLSSLTPSLPQLVKFLGWEMHGHACTQYILGSCDTSACNAVRFDENPFTCQCEKEDRSLRVSYFAPLLVIFKWRHNNNNNGHFYGVWSLA